MMNAMLYEQLKWIYTSYVAMKPMHSEKDYTRKAGGLIVTITAGKRNNR